MKIYVCGNPLLPEDNLPIRLMPKLQEIYPKHDFIWLDPTENLKPENGELLIIDTIIGIDQATLVNDIARIQLDRIVSLHDFDLAFNLKLLSKIGTLKRVSIFGVPKDVDEQTALNQIIDLFNIAIPDKP